MRRFYDKVSVSADLMIALDGRPVRTPAKAQLALPSAVLADAIAAEWRAQGEKIDPRSMQLCGLANAAIDRIAPDAAQFAKGLAQYAESELLCYRAESPPELIARQAERWDPILDWASKRYGVSFVQISGIMHQPQPPETLSILWGEIAKLSHWELAAVSPLVTISGSLVIPLALLDEAMEPEAAFATAHLDELWQAELWGEDDLAIEARTAHWRDFEAAARFLALLRA